MSATEYSGGASEHERRFELFGSRVRILIGPPTREELPSPEAIALQIEGFLRIMHRRLSRFDQDSELWALNAAPGESVQVSSLTAEAVRAALWAAQRSEGLIDPALVGELERAGYAKSRANVEPAPIEAALAAAPERRPAHPHPAARWRTVSVDAAAGVVRRPPGTRIDSGGTGKGLAADLGSERLAGYATHVVDAGGDLRLGGERPLDRAVRIEHPVSDDLAHEFTLDRGAVATSGIKTRLWRTETGFAHHLLDPSTGEPAWTGVLQATALAPTALEAETLAKMAFLSGPEKGIEILADQGGLIVLDDGSVELAGALAESESMGEVRT